MRKELNDAKKKKYSTWVETWNKMEGKKEEDLGLETCLRDKNRTKMGPTASMGVEVFILDVQRMLLQQLGRANSKGGTKEQERSES